MISTQTQISFVVPQPRKPTIISPKTNFHWINNRQVPFVWSYNGQDLQFQYEIEVILTNISNRSDIETTLSQYEANPSLFDVYSYQGFGNQQNITLNLSSQIPDDGVYIWRIRVKGTLAMEWSEWSDYGLIRTDSSVPFIRNISAITKSPVGGLAASISDHSFPYIYTNRTHSSSVVTDRHIDRLGQPGLYISYDYRDNSINIRAQSGDQEEKRYYGMISFHKDAESLTEITGSGDSRVYDSKYSVQNLVKSIYQYSINKEQNSLGPYDDIEASQIEAGKKIFPTLNEIIYSDNIFDSNNVESLNFVPKGFPTFFSESVYQNQGFSNHPIGFESSENYATHFPMYSRRFQQRTYKFPDTNQINFVSSGNDQYVEVRYPSPYQDMFLIFKQNGNDSSSVELVAYGQYSESDVKKIMENPSGKINDVLTISKGFSVVQNRSSGTSPGEKEDYQIFNLANSSLYNRSKIDVYDHQFISDLDENSIYNLTPFSYQIFFNLNATFDKDQAVKIYLREEAIPPIEFLRNQKLQGESASYFVPFPYVEFNFRPDADCTSVFTTEDNLGSSISLDEIFIGRSRISPRDLPQFNEDPSTKTAYKDIKIHYEDTVETVSGWGQEESVFNNDFTKFNGSFRINIPDFEFVPYYHYNSAYDNNGARNPVPHIYDADPNPNNDETINWDSITLKTASPDETEKDLFVLKNLIYNNDFARFNNTSKFLGQVHPFLYNTSEWNKRDENSIFGKGKLLKFRHYSGNGQVLSFDNISNLGDTVYEAGLDSQSEHPITYNQVDRGLFGLVSYEDGDEDNTSKIYLKEFSNHIFRRSIRVDIEEAIDASENIINSIYPSRHASHDRTFVWDGTNIESEDVQLSGDANGPSWILNLEEGTGGVNFISAIISSDLSSQGLYKNSSWARSNSIGFSGLYLTIEDSSSPELINEQIERSILGYDESAKESYLVRSEIQNNSLPVVDTDVNANLNAYITGDTFELGNVFGFIYPESNNNIKFFLDIDESSSGIEAIKFLEVDIPVELISGDSESELDSEHYFGIESSGKPTAVPVKLQRFNDEIYNYDPNSLSLSDDIFDNIRISRTPIDAVEYYMDNSPDVPYYSIEEKDILDFDISTTDYGFKRFTYTLAASGSGFKIFFFKVKDRAGNESNVYSVPIYIQGSQVITTSNDILSAAIAADDRLVISEEIKTLFDSDHEFLTNLIPTDANSSRSIVVRDVLTENSSGELVNYPYQNDLLIGFSDNYGLNYNVYSPFSAITSWNFKRPIPIRIKGFNSGDKGPDWYFDPNDVRHYVPDSSNDYAFGINDKNNILDIQSFHIPSNPGLTGRTLIGFINEGVEKYSRSNPVAKKILENKEEFIGKSLIIGSSNDLSFTILDVFESDYLPPAKRFNSLGQEIDENSADSDGGIAVGDEPREKIWLLIEDDEQIAALILSRKFQYITEENGGIYTSSKSGTGWRTTVKDEFSEENYVENFGYSLEEENIPSSVNDIVNDALNITKNIGTDPDDLESTDNILPSADDEPTSDLYIYIDPSDFEDTSSGISSNEGWTTRVYQGYSQISKGAIAKNLLNNLNHHQLLGINYYNKMIFGESYNIDAKISKISYNLAEDTTYILFSESGIDYTMRNIEYKIYDSSGNEVSLGDFNQTIKNVAVDGDVVSLYSDNVYNALNADVNGVPDDDYILRITINGLDNVDESTDQDYDRGWWPEINGLLVPPIDQRLGSSRLLWDESQVKFCTISTGSFYIPKDGEYNFRIEKDEFSYADFYIDFPDKDVTRNVAIDGEYVEKTTSINLESPSGVTGSQKSVYLTRGWHTARLRCRTNNTVFDSNYKNYLRLLYSKPGWKDEEGNSFFVPLIGSLNEDMNFMSRAYRSVFGRILDKDFNRYPREDWEIPFGETFDREANALRAVVGFRQPPVIEEISSSYNYQALRIVRDTGDDSKPTISFTSPAEAKPTFGGEILEEARATYISNIFDGGGDFRFWREIAWTPVASSQPSGTTVQFEVRTGNSEQDLLSKEWNEVSESNILDPFEESGQELIDFSQISVSNNEIILNRFIQFRMTLKSTVRNVTPVVDDVTITYSKQNSVNFFTTTFNLTSNIVRSILTYNGDIPESSSGVALSDIQFGICTEEDSGGDVITNFDRYTLIPTNEAFSLASIGVQENDKFRIGIRFISTEGSIPSVDEFSLMWETDDGGRDQVIDLISRVDNG